MTVERCINWTLGATLVVLSVAAAGCVAAAAGVYFDSQWAGWVAILMAGPWIAAGGAAVQALAAVALAILATRRLREQRIEAERLLWRQMEGSAANREAH